MTIGITGGIGSGKSYVARWLRHNYDMPVYDCDREAKRLMTCEPVRQEIVRLLGEEAYLSDGRLNKPLLAQFVFGSAEHQAAINAIVHPAVKADFQRWAAAREGLVVIESAILVEAGFMDVVDVLIAVEAPRELRLRRVTERDAATPEQVEARMRRQLEDEARREAADFVITNDGRDFGPQLRIFIDALLAQSAQNV